LQGEADIHGTIPHRIRDQCEIERQLRQGTAKIVSEPNWVWFARHLWPLKTAAHLAAIANSNERTAARWLSGEFDPPNAVMAVLIAKLFERKE
jgi:hypothetical protein